MRTLIAILIYMIIFLSACNKSDHLDLTNGFSVLYFEKPFINLGNQSSKLDSLDFSFAFEDKDLVLKTLAIPIILVGSPSSHDRRVNITIDWENSTIKPQTIKYSEIYFRTGHFIDTFYIKVNRDPQLKKSIQKLKLDLNTNNNFEASIEGKKSITFFITDQLTKPNWWEIWSEHFGSYHPEIFQKWMELYQPGVDPTHPLEPMQKPVFGWNNMPFTPSEFYYPVTFFYIDQLKKYFDSQNIYPGNDITKPPIRLPN